MKRPLALFGAAYLAAMFVAAWLPGRAVLLAAVVLAGAFFAMVVLRWLRRGRAVAKQFAVALVTMGAVVAALGVHLLYMRMVVRPALGLDGRQAQVLVRVTQTSLGYGDSLDASLEVLEIDGESLPRPLQVEISGFGEVEIGDLVSSRLSFYSFSQANARSQHAKGIYIDARASGPTEVVGQSMTLLCHLRRWQHAATQNLGARLPLRLSSVASAMSLGDKRLLTQQTRDNYRAAGLSHILVVSGLHLSIVSGGVYALLRRFARRRTACALSLVFVLLFMGFTGLTPSVVRSGVCFMLVYAAGLFHRRADIYTSLGAAAVLLCTRNPYAAVDVGLLLSFAATLGALQGGGWSAKVKKHWAFVGGRLGRAGGKLVAATMVPLAVTLATLPVLLFAGMGVSLLGIPANIITVPLVAPVVVCGALAALPAWPVVDVLAKMFALFAGVLLVLLEKITALCAAVPGAYRYIGGTVAVSILLLYPLALLAFKSRRFKAYALVGVLLLGLGASLQAGLSAGTVRIMAVGNGSASSLVVCRGGQAAVVYRSRNNLYAVQTALQKQGVTNLALLVDLRATASSTEYETALAPRQVVVADVDVLNRAAYQPFADVCIYVIKQGEGMAACVEVGGYRVALCSGSFSFWPYAPLDVLLAGRGEAKGVYNTLLCLGAPPDWAAPTRQILSGLREIHILIRPGVGAVFREVNDVFDTG